MLIPPKYRDKRTRKFVDGERVPVFEPFKDQIIRRLTVLDTATTLEQLRALPSNRLEALHGDRKTQYSIRINAQWRICFEWCAEESMAVNIEIVDYH